MTRKDLEENKVKIINLEHTLQKSSHEKQVPPSSAQSSYTILPYICIVRTLFPCLRSFHSQLLFILPSFLVTPPSHIILLTPSSLHLPLLTPPSLHLPSSYLPPPPLSSSQVLGSRLVHADQDILQLRAVTEALSAEKELITTGSDDVAQKVR